MRSYYLLDLRKKLKWQGVNFAKEYKKISHDTACNHYYIGYFDLF